MFSDRLESVLWSKFYATLRSGAIQYAMHKYLAEKYQLPRWSDDPTRTPRAAYQFWRINVHCLTHKHTCSTRSEHNRKAEKNGLVKWKEIRFVGENHRKGMNVQAAQLVSVRDDTLKWRERKEEIMM